MGILIKFVGLNIEQLLFIYLFSNFDCASDCLFRHEIVLLADNNEFGYGLLS